MSRRPDPADLAALADALEAMAGPGVQKFSEDADALLDAAALLRTLTADTGPLDTIDPHESDPEAIARVLHSNARKMNRWKAEATEVIDGWERVWEALGRPGALGQSKSQAVLDLLTADTPTVVEVVCPRCQGTGGVKHSDTRLWANCNLCPNGTGRRSVLVAPVDVLRYVIMRELHQWPVPAVQVTDDILAAITGETE